MEKYERSEYKIPSVNDAYKDKKSDIEIYPSDVQKGNVRSDFTHVVWYNR